MEGFCRGCLIKYDEPMELLQYTEKNRRLFVYSTGLQVKRNDPFTFQLCKDCFLNMKQACNFKKNCRTSDKRFKNYLALKDVGDPMDFCTFLKNNDDTLAFRLPMASGNSTPWNQKCRDDDNESTCTSIRNFMTDIFPVEEMPDTEAQIIKEVIEEETDVLDDSLDSHWLQDDMSIDTDFRLDLTFSPFSTPRSVNNDHCYTPKQKEDQVTFNTINTEKQTKILKDFTNAFKPDENIKEISIFVGAAEKTESFNNLKELSPFGIDEIDGMGKPETDGFKDKPNIKEFISNLKMDQVDGMDTLDNKTDNSNDNLITLSDFGIEEIDSVHKKENNNLESSQTVEELCNFGLDEIDSIVNAKSNALKNDKCLKELISNMDIEEIDGVETTPLNSNKSLNDLITNMDTAFGKSELQKDKNLKDFCEFSLDSFSGVQKVESKTHKTVLSLKELCDLSLDSIGSIEKPASIINKNNESLQELLDLSLNSFDDSTKSGGIAFKTVQTEKEIINNDHSYVGVHKQKEGQVTFVTINTKKQSEILKDFTNAFKTDENIEELSIFVGTVEKQQTEKELDLSLNGFDDIHNSGSSTFKTGRNIQEICDFGVDEINGNKKSESNLDLPLMTDVFERDKIDTPDYDLPKDVRSIQSQNDISNSSPNIEALLKDKPCTIEKNLEDALKDTDSQEFSLEDLLVSPTVYRATAAASTPTITNILFGEKLDTPDSNTRIEHCIDPYNDVEIFEEFFQNSTKEFYLEDIKRVNGVFTLEDWKKPIADNYAEIDDEENKSKNIEMDTSIDIKYQNDDGYDKYLAEPKNEIVEYITDTAPNDKFDIQKLYCKLCDIKYSTTRALNIHFSKSHKIKIVKSRNRNYIYEDDKTKTGSENEEIVDISDMPPNENFDTKNKYCNLCKIKYDTLTELSIHVTKTHLAKTVKVKSEADFSDIYFNDKFDLENLYCKLCDKKYSTGRALSLHFTKTHKIKIVKPKFNKIRNDNKVDVAVTDTYNDKFDIDISYCKLCEKKFKTTRALSMHFSIFHNIKIIKPKCEKKHNQKKHLCNNCGKKCEDSINFTRHVKICKLKNVKATSKICEYCQQEFTTQYNLEKHLASHTKIPRKKPTGKEIVCTICGVILRKKSNLALHMRKHNKEYSMKCEYCGKGYYRQSDLNAHVRQHTGDTPFSCTFCTRLFSRRDVLLRHIRIHLNERFFECDYCGLKCMNKYDLINHIKNKSCRKELRKKLKIKKEVVKENVDVIKENVEVGKENVDVIKENVEVGKENVEVGKENVDVENENVEVGKENIEVRKEYVELKVEEVDVKEKVDKEEVTVIYANGSDTFKQLLPFLETERSN